MKLTIHTLAKNIKKRLRSDFDLVIAITGEEGVGKSTIAIWLAVLIDPKFNFENNMSFFPDPNKVTREYHALKKYSVYILDEAVRAVYKMDWQSKLQQSLVKMYTTERWQNKVSILCIPRFWDLAGHFRTHRVKVWIHVMERGHAFVYIKNIDKDSDDPWHLKRTLEIKKKAFRRTNVVGISMEKRMAVERKLNTYAGDFRFPDLPEGIKSMYNAKKVESRKTYLEGEEEQESGGFLLNKYRYACAGLVGTYCNGVVKKELMEVTKLGSNSITKLKKYYKNTIRGAPESIRLTE